MRWKKALPFSENEAIVLPFWMVTPVFTPIQMRVVENFLLSVRRCWPTVTMDAG